MAYEHRWPRLGRLRGGGPKPTFGKNLEERPCLRGVQVSVSCGRMTAMGGGSFA